MNLADHRRPILLTWMLLWTVVTIKTLFLLLAQLFVAPSLVTVVLVLMFVYAPAFIFRVVWDDWLCYCSELRQRRSQDSLLPSLTSCGGTSQPAPPSPSQPPRLKPGLITEEKHE